MNRSYQLVNSNRARVKRFIENTNNEDQFFLNICLFILGRLTTTFSKKLPVMKIEKNKRKIKLKKNKKLIAQSWRRTQEDWTKKES